MKKLLLVLLCASAFADVKISQLPVASPALVGVNDVFPMVSLSASQTQQMKITDILNAQVVQNQEPQFLAGLSSKMLLGSSVPPTNAQLKLGFPSPPQAGAGYHGFVSPSLAGASYFVWFDGAKWWYILGTAAP